MAFQDQDTETWLLFSEDEDEGCIDNVYGVVHSRCEALLYIFPDIEEKVPTYGRRENWTAMKLGMPEGATREDVSAKCHFRLNAPDIFRTRELAQAQPEELSALAAGNDALEAKVTQWLAHRANEEKKKQEAVKQAEILLQDIAKLEAQLCEKRTALREVRYPSCS